MLRLTRQQWEEMVAHALRGLPLEACGLLAAPSVAPATTDGSDGSDVTDVTAFYPCGNTAGSAKLYTVDPRDHLRADRDAEDHGWEIVGVMHSHTHTDAYPSPTDVAQAPDPTWHYVIVSLKHADPVLRSYRITDGTIAEEPVELLA